MDKFWMDFQKDEFTDSPFWHANQAGVCLSSIGIIVNSKGKRTCYISGTAQRSRNH